MCSSFSFVRNCGEILKFLREVGIYREDWIRFFFEDIHGYLVGVYALII